jgi:hypothetical protein
MPNEMTMLCDPSLQGFKNGWLHFLVFPFHQLIWKVMNQHAFGLNIVLLVGWVLNWCGQDKLHLVNMFTMVNVHLSTSVSPQNALMCYVGKKCTRASGIYKSHQA